MSKFGRRNPSNSNKIRDKQRTLHKDIRIRAEDAKQRQQIHNSHYLKVNWEATFDDEDEIDE